MKLKRTILAFIAAFGTGAALAAPFAQWFDVKQTDGSVIRIWGEGDDYDAHFETADGRTVAYNPGAGRYEYVRKDEATGALVGTGVFLGDEAGNEKILSALPAHLRDTSETHRAKVEARWREKDEALGMTRRWKEVREATANRRKLKARLASGDSDSPKPTDVTTGTFCGFTLLVDFPVLDASGSVTNTLATICGERQYGRDYMVGLLNGQGWHKDGNYSSVRDYFYENSMGQLIYTNVCTDWVLAPRPRSHYDDRTRDEGDCARELIGDVLEVMKNDPDYETKYLPLLRAVTIVSGNTDKVMAFNVLFAGGAASEWSYGLWAHSWSLDSANASKLTWRNAMGRSCRFGVYQITALRSGSSSAPVIGTICHENGHMICGFPDYYHYVQDDNKGVGHWSLMSSGNHLDEGRHPAGIDAYTRIQVGWATPTDITESEGWIDVDDSYDCIYRFPNPANGKEYFLIENRQKTGCDQFLPAGGIQIWRCREGYSNTSATKAPASTYAGLGTYAVAATNRWSGELYLEQADGVYELERGWNRGDAGDVWYKGNTAEANRKIAGSGYTGVWNDDTASCSRWYDGTASGLALSHFSAPGEVMRVYVGVNGPPMQHVAFLTDGVVFCEADFPRGGFYSDLPRPRPPKGYAFVGWYTTKNGGTQVTADTIVSSVSSRTLYARWKKNPTLQVALDGDSLPFAFTTGGNGDWEGQCESSHDGVDAARSGEITHGQNTWMMTTVSGPGILTFWWNVSCEESSATVAYDYLEFLVDGVRQAIISGMDGTWQFMSVSVEGEGTHELKWNYRKDGTTSNGEDCGWVDEVTWTPEDATLEEALDNDSIAFSTGSEAPWFGQTAMSYDGADAAQSGEIPDGRDSWLEATVSGPGLFSFWWNVSCESDETITWDYLEFLVDGVRQKAIGGTNVTWQFVSLSVAGSGTHSLKWNYHKDGSVSLGRDRGWVDHVSWSSYPPSAITFDQQEGGGGTVTTTAVYGDPMPEITVPTRLGYIFGGYWTKPDGGGTQYYTETGVSARNWDRTSALTLYAQWTKDNSNPIDNHPPAFVSVTPSVGFIAMLLGATENFSIVASDPDGDTLTVTWYWRDNAGGEWQFAYGGATAIQFTPPYEGSFSVMAVVSDGMGGEVANQWSVRVFPKGVTDGGEIPGSGLVWFVTGKTLTISGVGQVPSYYDGSDPPYQIYEDNIEEIVVEEGVTGLGNYAFWMLWRTTSVHLPETLESIGAGTFGYCVSLRSVAVPASVTTIGDPLYPDGAFEGCESLQALYLSSSLMDGLDEANLDRTAGHFVINLDIYDFVKRLYRLCLGREPDQGGIDDWSMQLADGLNNGANVAYGFFMSGEMTNRRLSDGDFVETLYNVMMGRASDAGGKADWVSTLENGVSRAGVLRGFAESAEFTRICRDYGIDRGGIGATLLESRDRNFGITKFVARCYTKALGRAYDVDGLNYWCQQILSSPNPKATAVYVSTTGFFDSMEFQNRRLGNATFVNVLYQTFLGRAADADGMDYWVSQLNAGADRHNVMAGFYNSGEFNAIMAQYGIY